MTTETNIAPAAPAPATSDLAGQPLSREAALERIEQLKGDKEHYQKRTTSSDPAIKAAAQAEWTKLHNIAFAAPVEVKSIADVDAQAAARHERDWNEFFAAIRQRTPLTAENEAEMKAGFAHESVARWAREEKDRLVKDRGWYLRWKDGDRAANAEWGRVQAILGLRPVSDAEWKRLKGIRA